jgi:glycosyltransferase involved in cell wall biosynthesis
MRIIYDLRIVTGRMHGMARYGLKLLEAMLELEPELAVGALVRRPEDAQVLPADRRVVGMAWNLAPYGLRSQLRMPALLRRLDHQVYHCPFYAPPVRHRGPTVVTIHDLIHLQFPADHGLRHRLFYRWVVGPAARRAGAVLTVSRHSKNDIVRRLGVDPERVVVTPNGVDPVFRPLDEEARRAAPPRLGLPPSYILGVGNPRPHKNLSALVEAWRRLRRRDAAAPALVLVGLEEPGQAGAGPDEAVVRPHLEDEQLALAYAGAAAVCIPSLYEGFGLPALEALACGAPLVASNAASLPEVVGEAGLLAAPRPGPLAEALERVLADAELRRRLRAAGPERAAGFTWRAAARRTLEVYRRVGRGQKP